MQISAGGLSSDAAKLDKQLSLIFELADHWKALLLLNEADVFLRKYDMDYTHNMRMTWYWSNPWVKFEFQGESKSVESSGVFQSLTIELALLEGDLGFVRPGRLRTNDSQILGHV